MKVPKKGLKEEKETAGSINKCCIGLLETDDRVWESLEVLDLLLGGLHPLGLVVVDVRDAGHELRITFAVQDFAPSIEETLVHDACEVRPALRWQLVDVADNGRG